MFSLTLPTSAKIDHIISRNQSLAFSYGPVNGTQREEPVTGFENDHLRILIGRGLQDFEQAKAAIRSWSMFPSGWTEVLPHSSPTEVGQTVAVCIKVFGVWWVNTARVLYVVDQPNRFGFAYGTLPSHIEAGEELFSVELDTHGNVFYVLKAFSKPRWWGAKIGYPIVRLLQAKFRNDSGNAMRLAVGSSSTQYLDARPPE